MDRRRTALVLLLAFVVCIGIEIVVSGSRPGLQQGIAPTVVAFTGYLFALVAAVLLLIPAPEAPDRSTRTIGALVNSVSASPKKRRPTKFEASAPTATVASSRTATPRPG